MMVTSKQFQVLENVAQSADGGLIAGWMKKEDRAIAERLVLKGFIEKSRSDSRGYPVLYRITDKGLEAMEEG